MNDDTRLYINPKIYVADSKVHGRGVFSSDLILPGEILEQAHVIHPLNKGSSQIDEAYKNYFFNWPFLKQNWKDYVQEYGSLPINMISYPVCVLGFGMIYNHDRINPNASVEINSEENYIEFKASKKIEAKEEIFICYSPNIDFKNV
jgi:SET domain-containing protein